MRIGGHSRIGARQSRLRWGAASLVVAATTAVLAMPVGVAGASKAPPRGARAVNQTPRSELRLSQAPAGLRAAVVRSLGARGANAGWSQQPKLTAAGADFGLSAAISGSTAVIGAGGKNSGKGAAYVFVRSGTTWSEQAKLTASDAAGGDAFGDAVAISGQTVVVGAPFKTSRAGAAYVFVRSGTRWSQQQELTASDTAANDLFGVALSIYGQTAIVGASGENSFKGAAYVFVRSGTVWSQQARLPDPRAAAANDIFGGSVAIYGQTAVVGAFGKNSGRGAAYVFLRSGTAWSRQAKLSDPAPTAANDNFGLSVAISGQTAVIGAPDKNSARGAAYVFVRSGTAWSQQKELTASDGAAEDSLGFSVAISGQTAVVGAPFKKSATGAAYVFVRSGTAWSQQKKLTASDAAAGDEFGYSVAVHRSTAVVGAFAKNSRAGAAYVFARSGTAWSQQAKLTASGVAAHFTNSLASPG